jgi:hypothetical protein
MIQKISSLLFLCSFFLTFSQNKQVLYDFAELPQTLLLNPGAETHYKFHIGLPLLSHFSGEFSSSGIILSELFLSDGRAINDKVSEVLNTLDIRDYIKINNQIEVLSAGYRYDATTYISVGFYNEVDAISYFPKDVIRLLNEGNTAYINRSFDLSQLRYKLDVIGVLHVGITKEINKKLTLGGRFKIYSSGLNMETSNNSGTFTTVNGSNNIFTHYLDNVDVTLRTSGYVGADNETISDPSTVLKNSFLGGNLGIGFDLGITYKISKQLEFTGSLLDLGFVNHKDNIKTSFAKGNYIFEGIEFLFDPSNSPDYWADLDTDFKEKIQRGDRQDSYISWRPAKLNMALKYSFGEVKSKYCYDSTFKDFYANAFGIHLNTVFRALSPQLEFTGFYEKSFTEKLQAKVTYTIDNYSFYNIGFGVATQIGKINFYGMVDNILQFNDIASINSISLQLGVNLIFN